MGIKEWQPTTKQNVNSIFNGEEGFVMARLWHGNLWKMQIIVIVLRTQANMGPHFKCGIILLQT
jgi:hypothetical protein